MPVHKNQPEFAIEFSTNLIDFEALAWQKRWLLNKRELNYDLLLLLLQSITAHLWYWILWFALEASCSQSFLAPHIFSGNTVFHGIFWTFWPNVEFHFCSNLKPPSTLEWKTFQSRWHFYVECDHLENCSANYKFWWVQLYFQLVFQLQINRQSKSIFCPWMPLKIEKKMYLIQVILCHNCIN